MKKRWWIGGGAVVVVAAVVAVAVWPRAGAPEDQRLSPTVTDMQLERTGTFGLPEWWTDGSTTLRLTANADGLLVNEPLARLELTGPTELSAALPVPATADPAAIAALPGDDGAPWVAVAFEDKSVARGDTTTTERPLAWVAGGRGGAATAVPVPAELRSATTSETIMTAEAAVARIDDTDVAVVSTMQGDAATLHVCVVDACEWTPRDLPGGVGIELLGSTGDSLVAVTEDGDVWSADDLDLAWERVGSGPSGRAPQVIQDGDGRASIVWLGRLDGGQDEDGDGAGSAVSIQTVGDGELVDTVESTSIDDDVRRLETATEVDGTWYLGGSTDNTASVSLPYPADEPALWTLGDDSWEPLDDELLRNQVDQRTEAVWVDGGGDLRMLTTSAVQGITMVWRLEREES